MQFRDVLENSVDTQMIYHNTIDFKLQTLVAEGIK